METFTTTQDLMSALAVTMDIAVGIQKELNQANDRITDLRQLVQDSMQSSGIKTMEDAGLRASIRTKQYTTVTDEKLLKEHITATRSILDYTVSRFNTAEAKKDGAKYGWPGIETESRDELVVTLLKED